MGSRARRFLGPGLVVLAAAMAIVPLLLRGDSCGHDFDFHLVSWIDALHAWRHGIANPQWTQSANFNAGEPRFVFYPPLTWMLGAALGAVLPWTLVEPALAFLLLAGTGLATRALARQVLSNGAATLAGCIAMFSGYTLYTVYERSALAEIAGGIWMPLIVLLMLREYASRRERRVDDSPQGLKPDIQEERTGGTTEVVPCYKTGDLRGAAADRRGAVTEPRGVTPDRRGAVTEPRGVTPDRRGVTPDRRGVVTGRRGVTDDWRGVVADRRRVADGAAMWLGVVVAGAWLSNAPVGVMSCYLLAGVALAVAVTVRSWIPLMRAAAGVGLGLGLAAFYLVPAAYEQRWVEIRQAIDDPGEQIGNSFLFGHHANPQLALHDAELHRVSWIAVAMLALVAGAALVCWMRREWPGGRRWWIPIGLMPAAVLVLLLPVSLPLWHVLPKMQYLQFPWRWLVALEAPVGIFVAAAVHRQASGNRQQGRMGWIVTAAFGAVFLCLTMMADRVFFQVCDPYDAVPGMLADYREGNGFQGTDEYAPLDADNSLVSQDLPAGCLVEDRARVLGVSSADDPQPDWAAAQKSCLATMDGGYAAKGRGWSAQGTAPEAGFLVLSLRRYPRWRVTVNGRVAADQGQREDGLIEVPVTAGPVAVAAEWVTTPDVVWGRGISAAALLLLAGTGLVAWRKRKVG